MLSRQCLCTLVLAALLLADAARIDVDHKQYLREQEQQQGGNRGGWLKQGIAMAHRLGYTAGGALAIHHAMKKIPEEERPYYHAMKKAPEEKRSFFHFMKKTHEEERPEFHPETDMSSIPFIMANSDTNFGQDAVPLDEEGVAELSRLPWLLEKYVEGQEAKARELIVHENSKVFGRWLAPYVADLEIAEVTTILEDKSGMTEGEHLFNHAEALGEEVVEEVEAFRDDLRQGDGKPADFAAAGKHAWEILKNTNEAIEAGEDIWQLLGQEVPEGIVDMAKELKQAETVGIALKELYAEKKELESKLKVLHESSNPVRQEMAVGQSLRVMSEMLATISKATPADSAGKSELRLASEVANTAATMVEVRTVYNGVRFYIGREDITGDVEALRAAGTFASSITHIDSILRASEKALKVADNSAKNVGSGIHKLEALRHKVAESRRTMGDKGAQQSSPEESKKAFINAYVSAARMAYARRPSLFLLGLAHSGTLSFPKTLSEESPMITNTTTIAPEYDLRWTPRGGWRF